MSDNLNTSVPTFSPGDYVTRNSDGATGRVEYVDSDGVHVLMDATATHQPAAVLGRVSAFNHRPAPASDTPSTPSKPPVVVYLTTIDADTFGQDFGYARGFSPRIAEATSYLDLDTEPAGTRYFSDRRYGAGYAIRPDGELVYVHSLQRGIGAAIVDSAIRHGAVYLDCFDGYLPDFYARHGFQVDARVPNWTPGGPDVVYMSLPGYSDRHGYKSDADTCDCPTDLMGTGPHRNACHRI